MALQPRKFDTIYGQVNLTGFIAQEVQDVLPDMVDDSEPDDLKVSTGPLIPRLVKAMQELNNKVENLEAENLQLKARLAELEAK